MRRTLLAAALAVTFSAQAQNATLPSVATAVAAVDAFYGGAQTFSADFTQQYFIRAQSMTKSSRGHVVFAKPGKMDWEYADPKDNRVVSDGVKLRMYEAANKQMIERPMSGAQLPAAFAFLTGQGSLAQSFAFEIKPGAELAFQGGYVLVGTPTPATPAYAKVLFYVDAATSQILRVLILDGQQNRNRFDFTNAHVNTPASTATFTFTPPTGTTIIH